ncbi:MAG: hypothetical protein L3K52_09530 [Candidatus Thiothrix sulfatifontis]|nr:MAG: hypothetical protein L3K52_09530 [Candidatus Thiothrix sulfatifontis]
MSTDTARPSVNPLLSSVPADQLLHVRDGIRRRQAFSIFANNFTDLNLVFNSGEKK